MRKLLLWQLLLQGTDKEVEAIRSRSAVRKCSWDAMIKFVWDSHGVFGNWFPC